MGCRVEPVEVHYGELRLRVAIDDQSNSSASTTNFEAITSILEEIAIDPDQRIELVKTSEHADWFVRCTEANELFLVPSAGWSKVPDETYFGPAPIQDRANWLRERLGRISRVKNLLKLCGASEKQSGGILSALVGAKRVCDVKAKLFGISPETEELVAIDWLKRNRKLVDGEQVVLQVTNSGSGSIDFSVLFIDSTFGITPLFPPPGVVADNRLQPGQSYSVGPMEVESSTLGLEHLLVIATTAEGQPPDFSWLAQSSVEVAKRGLGNEPKDSLDSLLHSILFSKGNVRGMRLADAEGTCLRAVSWQTVSE